MASFSQSHLPKVWEPPFVDLFAGPSNLQKELTRPKRWVNYSLTPYGSRVTADGEEEYKKTKHGKRLRRFLHDGALVRQSKASSVYCTASLRCRRFLVPVRSTVQE